MTTSTRALGPTITPALFYRDAAKAIDWLAEAFGFRKRMVVNGEAGAVAHAELSLGDGVVMLGTAQPDKGWMSPDGLAGVSVCVCIFVEDVDAHHDRARAAGATIVMEPHDTSYGSRAYSARDFEGHHWEFGNYRPGNYWDAESE